jgi:hypothetical protein
MAQLYWPETAGTARRSVSQLDDHQRSPSMELPTTSYHKSDEIGTIDEVQEQSSNLFETPSHSETEPAYDGLIALDEILLDKMVETDIISHNG